MTSTARSRSKRGIVVRLLTGLAVIFGLTVAVAGPASAHHPEISGSVDCTGKASFTSTAWATSDSRARANSNVVVEYTTDGSTWRTAGTGAYSSPSFQFSGDVQLTSAVPVKFRAKAVANWGNGARGGQVTTMTGWATPPTDCDKSGVTISYDCANYTVKLNNYESRVPVTFSVTVNGETKEYVVPAGQIKDITARVEEGKTYTITVKVGSVVKGTKTFTVDCDKSSATIDYTCTGYTVKLVNTGSTKDVVFDVTVNGEPKQYTVTKGQTTTLTGNVVENTQTSIVVKVGTETKATKSYTPDCSKPAATFAYDCAQWSGVLDNTGSTVATTFTVTVNSVSTPYTVPAKQTQPIGGTVTEDQAYTVSIVADGKTLVEQSFTVDCTTPPVTPPPPPPVVTPPPPNNDDDEPEVEGVQASGKAVGNLKVTCQGTVRVVMKNKSSSRAVYTVKVAKKSTKIAVKADSNKRWETTGKPKQVAKLMLGKKVLAQKKLPTPCRKPDVLPNTGKKPLGSAARSAAPTLSVPSLGVNAAIQSTGLTARGALAVGPSVTKVYSWRNGVKPGQRGSAVIAGHTYSRGAGVFDNLGKLSKGDRFTAGKATFKVTRVQKVRGLSQRQVADLFSDRGKARAVLVTCGDRTADGIYHSRILVFADKV